MSKARLLARILAHDRGRDPQRLLIKYAKMRSSAFSFLRGTAFLFYEDCPLPKRLVASPRTWISGDLHLENFGAYKGANRLVYFDINDFDEALCAPCVYDPARLATSLLTAAGESALPRHAFRIAARTVIGSYFEALANGKPYWIERRIARGPIRLLLRRAARRSERDLLQLRCVGNADRRRLRLDGQHALPASPADQRRVRRLMRLFGRMHGLERFCRVLDVARRIAGTGSLGLERFVVLCAGTGGTDGAVLFDLKAEVTPAAVRVAGARRGNWTSDAERTVAVQMMMQAASPAWLGVLRDGKHSVVVRELQPQEDRVRVAKDLPDGTQLLRFAGDIGRLAAWSQLRATGRRGAATADDLMAFAMRRHLPGALFRYAEAAARHNQALFREFRALAPADLCPAPRRRRRAALSS
jgi:uncharacterized protein (DUF2252 family)